MLLSFRTANHRSIRAEQQLLLTPQYGDGGGSDAPAVRVAAIFGANAAGKSNVLDALRYMTRMVRSSLRDSEPGAGVERYPFALDATSAGQPSHYVVDVQINDVRYTYGFAIDDLQVVEEWLRTYPKVRPRLIFKRQGDRYEFGSTAPASMRDVRQITEPNVLFLSVAARSRQKAVAPVYEWFSSALRFYTPISSPMRTAAWIHPALESDTFRDRLSGLLRAADLGIEGIEILESDLPEDLSRVPGELLEVVRSRRRFERDERRLAFRHRGGGEVRFDFRDQSLGTRALYRLAVPALLALDEGSVLVVDELDASLHPYLSARLIRQFRDPTTNPHGAQLLFTTHDVALLGRVAGEEVLARDHVWFVQKDESGATELFPLTDFKPRTGENRERRYLAGRYGAVPTPDDECA